MSVPSIICFKHERNLFVEENSQVCERAEGRSRVTKERPRKKENAQGRARGREGTCPLGPGHHPASAASRGHSIGCSW